ncbi:hypothetical protein DOTSEDRAFT_23444 [Dothistroma septosporum NZE10]|uniref:BTB domain-containing protein n=1 Tax=Dothistroma septosporum (strain NZE10 / CBS 128990) TaxID=675120 RepID=N1PR50_DOTSN|nr:hypothetical protein DOTSEDRAFT_23444 [Dothistroma septosporum NZE10]
MALPSTSDRSPGCVGRNNGSRTFEVHEGVLSFYSGYFKTTLADKVHNGAIKLPDEDPTIFEAFSLWL